MTDIPTFKCVSCSVTKKEPFRVYCCREYACQACWNAHPDVDYWVSFWRRVFGREHSIGIVGYGNIALNKAAHGGKAVPMY